MTGEEAIAYIHAAHWESHAPGLERMRTLLAALGNPEKKLKFVHVAGTNGKGSTCAMIASVLQAAGYRVGLNTSPYLVTFHERIAVNERMISDEELGELTEEIRPAAEAMAEHPTEFELITAIALVYFVRQNCDIVVLEVGLGGALDASNVIDTPEVAVVTAMGMDHVALLGPTLGDIARAKAGIIKPGGRVVSYGGCPEADKVIADTCRHQGAKLTQVDFSRLGEIHLSLEGAEFALAPYGLLHIPLAGAYQVRNAATAITALEALEEQGWTISPQAMQAGLAAARWPGRFEVLRRRPVVLLDGAHNAHGMAAAAESLKALFPGEKLTFILGILADKDVEAMADLVAGLAREVFCLRPDNPRALDAQSLCRLLEERGVKATACPQTTQAVADAVAAAGEDGVVCALGSLYFSAEIRRAVEALPQEK